MRDFNLLRYLIVLRPNAPLAWFANHPSVELSVTLGHAVAERLPTSQARLWYKRLAAWEKAEGEPLLTRDRMKKFPEHPWPVDVSIISHMTRRTYGQGEPLLFELKLMGEAADHGFFLEVIMPALEGLGFEKDVRWHYPNTLWGNYDIDAVYAARGLRWEPLVAEGQLNLDCYPSPNQWLEQLPDTGGPPRSVDVLQWITPFDLESDEPPSLVTITGAFLTRMAALLPGRADRTPEAVLAMLDEEDRMAFHAALDFAGRIPVTGSSLTPVPPQHPGRWEGRQTFATVIPEPLRSYLNLASIFQIGRYTHFGCGIFTIP